MVVSCELVVRWVLRGWMDGCELEGASTKWGFEIEKFSSNVSIAKQPSFTGCPALMSRECCLRSDSSCSCERLPPIYVESVLATRREKGVLYDIIILYAKLQTGLKSLSVLSCHVKDARNSAVETNRNCLLSPFDLLKTMAIRRQKLLNVKALKFLTESSMETTLN
jgi:hypothetical protein